MCHPFRCKSKEHCKEYDKAAQNNVTSIYFSRKYRLATRRLSTKGYKINTWDLRAQQSDPVDARISRI